MAFFGITIEEIEEVSVHPNADRMEMVSLCGMSFQGCVGKGLWKKGDRCLYFPLDSLFPFELMEKMELTKKIKNEEGRWEDRGLLAGPDFNRLKTIRLRGQISQGVIGSLSLIDGLKEVTPETITKFLGIEKFDPPPVEMKNADLHRLPAELSVYDIEGADRFVDVLGKLMDRKVWISEKLEGENFSVTYISTTDQFFVNQRQGSIVVHDGKTNEFWETAKRINLPELIKKVSTDGKPITMYGEIIGPGIKGNIYFLSEKTVHFFDIKIGYDFLDVKDKLEIFKDLGLNHRNIVPRVAVDVVLREWLDGKTVQEASDGYTILHDENIRREGIVITPMVEDRDNEIGRLILKQRSPLYLERE